MLRLVDVVTMRRYLLVLIAAVLTCFCGEELAAQPATFRQMGYSIDVLDAGPSKSGSIVVLNMFLPAQDGFASNVNVQHQAFAGTLEDYVALSKKQFEKAGWNLINVEADDGAYTVEALGRSANREFALHFYFRMIKSGDNVILATATAPQSRWHIEKAVLMPVVDSLKPIHSEIP